MGVFDSVSMVALHSALDGLAERQRAIAKKAGYEMTDHYLNIFGICADCRKKKK